MHLTAIGRLSQVLQLLSVQWQALSQRSRICQAQLVREGSKFEPLDNGVLSCANPKRLQKICDAIAEKIDGLLRSGCVSYRPLHRRRIGSRLSLDISILAGRILAHAGADRQYTAVCSLTVIREISISDGRAGAMIVNRRISRRTPACFARASSPRTSRRPCMPTTGRRTKPINGPVAAANYGLRIAFCRPQDPITFPCPSSSSSLFRATAHHLPH